MKYQIGRLAVAVSLLLAPIGAFSAEGLLEEVVVTAQKREQNLQDVSVAVTAFRGETLEQLGVRDPKDIANLIPNVSAQATENFPSFNIRGVQLLDFGDGNESPVGFYVDEVYYGTPAGQVAALFDIERAEVLRGAQGTLFGRNSTGGLVHFITNKPTEETEVRAMVEYSSDDQVIVEGAVSGALGDAVRARLAARRHQRDAWQAGSAGQPLGDASNWSVRAMLEFDVGDSLLALLTVNATEIDDQVPGSTALGLNDPNIGFPAFPGAPFNVYPVPCASEAAVLDGRCVNLFGDPSTSDPEKPGTINDLTNDTKLWGLNLRLEWSLSDRVELVSVTALHSVEKILTSDAEASPSPAGLTQYEVDAEAFSQELRLSGATDALDWIVGAFLYDDKKDPLRFLVPEVVFGLQGGSTFGANGDAVLDTRSWALFGQLEYGLSESLSLTGGVRVTDEQKDLLISDNLASPSAIPGTDIPFRAEEEISETEVTGRFGVDWRPAEGTLAYLSVATGYKSGAFNTVFPVPGSSVPSASEQVVNYELGLKTTLLDGALRFNSALFHADYSDLQNVIVPAGLIASIVANVGDANIYGLEVEMVWQATENLDVVLNLGLLDSKISSAEAEFDDHELPYTADFSANALVSYRFPVAVLGGELMWTHAVKYVGKHFQTVQNEFTSVQDSYAVFDTVLRWTSADSRYFLEGFVKNIGDEDYSVDRYQVSALGVAVSTWERFRHGGIRMGMNL